MKFSFGFYCLVYQIIKLQNHKFVKLHYKHVAAGSSGSEKEKEWSLPSFYLCLLAVKFRYQENFGFCLTYISYPMPLVFFHYCSFTSKPQFLLLLYVGHICKDHVVYILRWSCGLLHTYTTHCFLCMYALSFNLSCCHSELQVHPSVVPIRTETSTESCSSVSEVLFKMAVTYGSSPLVNTSASYLDVRRFKSRSGDSIRLVYTISESLSKYVMVYCLKIGHNRFLRLLLHLLSTNHLRVLGLVTDSIVKLGISKLFD